MTSVSIGLVQSSDLTNWFQSTQQLKQDFDQLLQDIKARGGTSSDLQKLQEELSTSAEMIDKAVSSTKAALSELPSDWTSLGQAIQDALNSLEDNASSPQSNTATQTKASESTQSSTQYYDETGAAITLEPGQIVFGNTIFNPDGTSAGFAGTRAQGTTYLSQEEIQSGLAEMKAAGYDQATIDSWLYRVANPNNPNGGQTYAPGAVFGQGPAPTQDQIAAAQAPYENWYKSYYGTNTA